MCGIFGVVSQENSGLKSKSLKRVTNYLFKLSESRGKEASGLTLLSDVEEEPVFVIKSPLPASDLIKSSIYKETFGNAFGVNGHPAKGLAFGHTRLVTNGSQLDPENNQPIIYDGIVAVHNGIIVNVEELWAKHKDLKRNSGVDTEVLVALLRKYYNESGALIPSVIRVFSEINGTASIAATFNDIKVLLLATNNGSLYFTRSQPGAPLFFASERHILEQLIRNSLNKDYSIAQIYPNTGMLIDLEKLTSTTFEFDQKVQEYEIPKPVSRRSIKTISAGKALTPPSVFDIRRISVPKRFEEETAKMDRAVKGLKRCTRCIMTETVPFIEFNAQGVCNFCENYKKIELMGLPVLEEKLKPYRKPGREAECVMALSGGRDSCYGLHYIVKELGMKPIAYTYDWGMVTDLARRNIARLCSRLGVEHIIVSANIAWKRANIRKNIGAWLKNPHLGMIPLFMAGDKHLFYYANQVKKQNRLELDIFTFNLLEKTQFKEEFTGIQFWKPGKDSDMFGEQLQFMKRIKLGLFYSKNFISNPGYWNSSLWDTFSAYFNYYYIPQKFVPLFRYVEWREETVNQVLLNEYNWELATDTTSTWRIGDGTASFYNYIYYMVAGFTENDTMRSNQIREGHITREQAMEFIGKENRPRWDTFKWYCDIIGLNFEATVEALNKIEKLHPALKV